MANSVQLEVITPSREFYKGDVELVIVPTVDGEEGYMANHVWACKLLDIGEMWIQEAGSSDFRIAVVAGGFVDVKDSIIIYTDAAEWEGDIDVDRAKSTKARLEEWLANQSSGGAEYTPDNIRRAQIGLARQLNRLKIASGGGRRKR